MSVVVWVVWIWCVRLVSVDVIDQLLLVRRRASLGKIDIHRVTATDKFRGSSREAEGEARLYALQGERLRFGVEYQEMPVSDRVCGRR